MSKSLSSPLDVILPPEVEEILSPTTIRERARMIFDYTKNESGHFELHLGNLASCAEFVAKVTRTHYPELHIPIHGRWNHFKVSGVDFFATLLKKLDHLSGENKARALWDLCLVSVLLDAGAGDTWSYQSSNPEIKIGRSEGLALASLDMFSQGMFSSDSQNPFQVDAAALKNLNLEKMKLGFQISATNELQGLEGRLKLLIKLGEVIENSQYFHSRPSDLFLTLAEEEELKASDLLKSILLALGSIWPSRLSLEGVPLGDVWKHSAFDQLVPFHKLSQWLTYSMITPYEILGKKVLDIQDLTGLPEYRNGGLFLDTKVIALKEASELLQTHRVDSDLIIEWRALTVYLLDEIAPLLRSLLGKDELSLPLGSVLEGGTWNAGRAMARELRGPKAPAPLKLNLDGTVF